MFASDEIDSRELSEVRRGGGGSDNIQIDIIKVVHPLVVADLQKKVVNLRRRGREKVVEYTGRVRKKVVEYKGRGRERVVKYRRWRREKVVEYRGRGREKVV